MKMNYAFALAIIGTIATSSVAYAESESGDDHANCHASFLRDCGDGRSSSSPSEAPLPLLGASPLALLALGAVSLYKRRRQRDQAA